MARRPAQITQADVARVIRAAKQAGAAEVVIQLGEQSVIVRFTSSTGDDDKNKNQEIVL
jgi:2-iminoacetate synthase ThiH